MGIKKGITLQTKFTTDTSAAEKDIKRMRKMAEQLSEVRIKVAIDLPSIQKETKRARSIIENELSNIKPAASTSQKLIPKSYAESLRDFSQTASSTLKESLTTFVNDGRQVHRVTSQIARGIQNVRSTITDKNGNVTSISDQRIDTSSIQKLKDNLSGIETNSARPIANAQGLKDSNLELRELVTKAEKYKQILSLAKDKNQHNTKEYIKAENSLNRLNARITKLSSSTNRDSQSKLADALIKKYQTRLKLQIDENKKQLAAAKAIHNRIDREKAVNRVYREREKLIQRNIRSFSRLETSALKRNRSDVAARAQTQINNGTKAFSQTQLDRERFNIAENAGKVERSLRSRINRAQQQLKLEIARLNKAERIAAKIKDQTKRESELQRIYERRVSTYTRLANILNKVQAKASRNGLSSVANLAGKTRTANEIAALNSAEKLNNAIKLGQRNLDFHSSSLTKNAKSIIRWMVPLRLIQGLLESFSIGIRAVIDTERQFATLQAVFRGSAQETQLLKEQTLELAAAQGRSNKEALDATIRFARLGLTRQQTLRLTETALIAANVAEISAGEAAEKLSSIYASYNLTVTETVLVLDKLNAISNTYNTTNKDLLDGIARSGGTARQAGLDIAELSGVIGSLVGATGRSGSEAGNALNFIITRIRKTENLSKLQDIFEIDLTQANGEIKEFDEILRILSDRYNELSDTQQDQLVEMAAGARQANRFRLSLENYRQAQVLTARANLDSNSALKENTKITSTLEASLKSLRSEWEQLFITLADAGVLDGVTTIITNITDTIHRMGEGLGIIKDQINDLRSDEKETAVSPEARRALNDNNLGGFGGRKFTTQEIEDRIQELKAAKEEIANESSAEKYLKLIGSSALSLSGDTYDSVEALDRKLQVLEATLDNINNDNKLSTLGKDASQSAKIIAQSKDRIIGLRQGATVFEDIKNDITDGNVAQDKINRSFIEASKLLFNLDNGAQHFAQTFGTFLDLAARGDNQGLINITENLSSLFNDQSSREQQAFSETQRQSVERLTATIVQYQNELVGIGNKFDGVKQNTKEWDRLNKQLDKTQQGLSNAQESLTTVTRGLKDVNISKLTSGQATNLKKYLDDIKAISSTYKDTLNNLSVGNENNADRAHLRRVSALELESQLLSETLEKTKQHAQLESKRIGTSNEKAILQTLNSLDFLDPESLFAQYSKIEKQFNLAPDRNIDAASDHADRIESLKKRLNETLSENDALLWNEKITEEQRNYVTSIETEIKLQQKNLELKRKQLEMQRQAALIQQNFNKGVTDAKTTARAFLIGGNQSEKQINQTARLFGRGADTLHTITNNPFFTDNEKLQLRGKLLQDESTIKGNILSLEQRQQDIQALKLNKLIEHNRQLDKEVESRSKALQLASREEQLRAAAIRAAVSNNGGPLSRDQFTFLSQASRQNIDRFNPRLADGIDESTNEFNRSTRELNNETSLINQSLKTFRQQLTTLSTTIDSTIKTPTSTELGFQTFAAQQAAQKNAPTIFNVDPTVNIELDINKSIQEMTNVISTKFEARLANEIKNLKATLQSPLTTSPAANL